ncbi:MAG TPA: DUF1569 domain-containing protein [Vicinamibacterales bacterium]|nr:DUF1569 domain-containing protein [Vicinamibacterales bacterium]
MHRYLQAALDEVDAAAGALDTSAIARPVEGRWSIAEILEHLTLAFTLNSAALEKAIATGERRARPPGLLQWLGRMVVVEAGYFPRARAPEKTMPAGSIPAARSLEAIRDALTDLDVTLCRAEQEFGEHVRVANHPYFAGMTVAQWRKFHWRHTQHHMRQVRERAARREPIAR